MNRVKLANECKKVREVDTTTSPTSHGSYHPHTLTYRITSSKQNFVHSSPRTKFMAHR